MATTIRGLLGEAGGLGFVGGGESGVLDARDSALAQFQPSMINSLYQSLLRHSQGDINAMLGQQAMAGQAGGRSAIAGLNRAGLGNTGLGAGLSAAIQRGSAYEGNLLRARIQDDLRKQATSLAQMRAGVYSQQMSGLLGIMAAKAGKPEQPEWWQSAAAGGVGAFLATL